MIKSLEEGITFIENIAPEEAVPDPYGAVAAMRFSRTGGDGTVELPARSVLVAAGTTPNITYEEEAPGTFQLDAKKRFFQPHEVETAEDGSVAGLRPAQHGFFTSYNSNVRLVSFYGDNHPYYACTVVKAMTSAKHGYPQVAKLFARELAALDPATQADRDRAWTSLVAALDDQLVAKVREVVRLTQTTVEVIACAPAAVRHFRPGQFFRLQNYETTAVSAGDARLLMEGIALTGAWVDRDRGLLSLIALELGVSSRLCAYLRPGARIVVMGPTGTPTEIPKSQVVLLAGGGLGNAVLFSIARALRESNNTVVYFAGYKKGEDLFKREEIEASTDQIVWSTDAGAPIEPHRPEDVHIRANIVQAVLAYARGELGQPVVPLDRVDRIIAIGSDRMMAAVKAARHGVLKPYLKPTHVGIASINSPMQCMMKKVCAQCMQRHVDPATGKESIVFSCSNQDQEMDHVDFVNLAARLRQTTGQEKLSNLWLAHLLAGITAPHI